MSIGRNDPCHCGSGKKYKKCCQDKDRAEAQAKKQAATPLARFDPGTDDSYPAKLVDYYAFILNPPSSRSFHPYCIEKALGVNGQRKAFLEERCDVEPGKDLTGLEGKSTEELEARLTLLVPGYDREKLLAEGVAGESVWLRTAKWPTITPLAPEDARFIGAATCHIYARFCPDKPSLEMVDDWVTEGTALCHMNRSSEGITVWQKAIRFLVGRITPEMKSLREAGDALFPNMSGTFAEVIRDYCDVRGYTVQWNDGTEVEDWHLIHRVATAFADDPACIDIGCFLGDIYYHQKRTEEGGKWLTFLAGKHPDKVPPLVCLLGNLIHQFENDNCDYAAFRRASVMLEQALARLPHAETKVLREYPEDIRHILSTAPPDA
jgi:hypothetical protein